MKPVEKIVSAYLRLPGLWLFAFCTEAAAICILSLIPSIGDGINSGLAAHLLAYSTFSFTAGILLITKKIPRAIVKGACIATLFGAAIELAQYFTTYRSGRISDAAINCCAAFAGMAVAGMMQLTVFRAPPVSEEPDR